jgi:hypothetical protein
LRLRKSLFAKVLEFGPKVKKGMHIPAPDCRRTQRARDHLGPWRRVVCGSGAAHPERRILIAITCKPVSA